MYFYFFVSVFVRNRRVWIREGIFIRSNSVYLCTNTKTCATNYGAYLFGILTTNFRVNETENLSKITLLLLLCLDYK